MNRSERQVAQAQLNAEEKALKELRAVYKKAREDVREKIADFSVREDMNPENLQSIIYQRQFQEAILEQLNDVLGKLENNQYSTVEEYLTDSYYNGYIGNAWLLHRETGVPFLTPIDQKQVRDALTIDSQLSENYYKEDPIRGRLAENIDLLKTRVRTNISRGVAGNQTWLEVATNLASGMNNPFETAFKDAMRIVRTEGHRVQIQGSLDAGEVAKSKGADILKQWDATLDERTRPTHRALDGQIVEWSDPFVSPLTGECVNAPSQFGDPAEDINCRCALLQRARWALDEDELKRLEDRADYYGIDKTDQFEEFKSKYLKLPENADTVDYSERRRQRLQQLNEKKFIPAKDMNEVKKRCSNALGIDESLISFGRMKIDLANQYLDGIETFMSDFPQMKGLYTGMDTKCGGRTLGVNKLEGKGRRTSSGIKYDISFILSLRSPTDVQSLYDDYEYSIASHFQYKGMCPKATAIHELVHGLDHAITMKKNGYFSNGILQTEIDRNEWYKYSSSISYNLVNEVKTEMFGSSHGALVYDGTSYLGDYAMTNSSEMLAQAVSYEYMNPSNPFGARVLEKLKEMVGETF